MIRQLQQRLSTPAGHAIAVLAVVVIGLGLRVYKLDAQSFWYDEGNSVRIAERSIQLIIEGAAGDIHPPLYYLVLHFWRAVFGDSEAALRGLSVLCGTSVIVLTYLVGAALLRPRSGFVAALLVAFSPFAVYYSQEARMYVMLALFALASTWALAELSRGEEKRGRGRAWFWGVLAAVATAGGLYTQYAYPFVMVAQGVCVVLWLVAHPAHRLRNLLVYSAINVAALVLYLPWLPIAIRQITAWGVAPQTYDLGPAMLDAARWLAVGRTLPLGDAQVTLFVMLLLVAAGLTLGMIRQGARRAATTYLLLLVLLPFGLLFVFKLYREAYLKFLLVCVAPLLLLVAHGIVRMLDLLVASVYHPTGEPDWVKPARFTPDQMRFMPQVGAGVLALMLIGTLMLPSLNNLYNNPAYARDDYRGIARTIESGARPGDAILFSAPNQWEVFTYYHRTGAPAIPAQYRPVSAAAVDAQMAPLLAQYTRLFVLYYAERESDPSGWYERWLAEHAYKADEQWVGNIRLAVYALRPTAPASDASITATFGKTVVLTATTVDAGNKATGDLLTLKLMWRALSKPAGTYKVFVHVGAPDAPPVAQNDSEPVAGFRPTAGWNANDEITDQRAVWIKPGTPPGTYGVYIGMYDTATEQRLPISTPGTGTRVVGDRLWVGDVVITAGQ